MIQNVINCWPQKKLRNLNLNCSNLSQLQKIQKSENLAKIKQSKNPNQKYRKIANFNGCSLTEYKRNQNSKYVVLVLNQ